MSGIAKPLSRGAQVRNAILGWRIPMAKESNRIKKKACEWYQKAAEQGSASAQFNLGVAYYCGEGVTRDLKTAAEWYQKAAEQGDAIAQFNLRGCVFQWRRG